jgi:hypothetical protein
VTHWNQPEPWTVVLVCVLVVILGAHNRLARAIGTAAPSTADVVAALRVPVTPPVTVGSLATATPGSGAPLPTHAPHDPFRALVDSNGDRVAQVALPTAGGSPRRLAHRTSVSAATGSSAVAPTGGTPVGAKADSPFAPRVVTAGPAAAGGPTTAAHCADVHVVQAGESLWSIAQHHVNQTGRGNTGRYWHRIYVANQSRIGPNPGLISVGVSLCLPP